MTTTRLEVTFACPGCEELDTHLVSAFTGKEQLNGLPWFEVDLLPRGDGSQVKIDGLVGQRGVLKLGYEKATSREIHGVITQAEHIRTNRVSGSGLIPLRITLNSDMWEMSRDRLYRVHENMTPVDTVRKVCNDWDITHDVASGQGHSATIVQYGESSLDLVTRLLSQEGLAWIPIVSGDGTKLSAVASHESFQTELILPFSAMGGDGTLNRFEGRERVTTGTYSFSSVSAHQPQHLPLDTAQTASKRSSTAHFADHSVGQRDPVQVLEGRKPTKFLADRANALAKAAWGRSSAEKMRPGIAIEVDGHPYDAYNTAWVVSEVSHSWRAASPGAMGASGKDAADGDGDEDGGGGASSVYRNEFTCVPRGGATLRPALEEPNRVHGLRLGRISSCNVDGATDIPGSTVSAGVYGVEFPSEGITQYMRVVQPWAGPERGFHFPLEVGDEVVVGHHHGDPARPFIIGSLHGVDALSPVVSTQGGQGYSGVMRSRTGHELRYDDDPGLKRILIKSGTGDHQLEFHDSDKKTALTTTGTLEEKVGLDHTSEVEGNRTTKITKNDDLGIDGDRKIAIKKGEVHTVGEDHALTVTGAENHSVGKDLTLKVDGASAVTVAKDAAETIKGAYSLDVTKDLAATVSGGIVLDATKAFQASGKTITLEANDTLTLKCGSAKIILEKNGNITIDGGKIAVKGSGDVAIKGSKTAVN